MGWNPWRALRSRPHLDLAWAYLSTGWGRIEDTGGGRRRITIQADLDRRQRSEVLGHELVHDELDLLWSPEVSPAVVEKGERLVERINAERTIPLGALRSFVDRRVASEMSVTALDVSEEFDVTEELAGLALRLL